MFCCAEIPLLLSNPKPRSGLSTPLARYCSTKRGVAPSSDISTTLGRAVPGVNCAATECMPIAKKNTAKRTGEKRLMKLVIADFHTL